MSNPDLAIIGAGPAGMAAADEAASLGLSVLLLDEQPTLGGQIYRDVERVAPLRGAVLGQDYLDGLPLAKRMARDGIEHVAGAMVWQVTQDGTITYSKDNCSFEIRAGHILIATGAVERPMPLPGWTLPSVMSVGAGQILLKQSGLIPNEAVLIGSGPLLYVLAYQMLKAKRPPLAMVETQTMGDMAAAMPHLGGALRGWRYLLKGSKLLAALMLGGVKRYTGAKVISLEGEDMLRAVRFEARGKPHRLECQTALLHHGVVPNNQISLSLGLAHSWNQQQTCFCPDLDKWGQTSLSHVFVAGDGAGIGGAKAAELAGKLSALRIAEQAGRISAIALAAKAKSLQALKARELSARPFLDRAYPPFKEAISPKDETIICRCEEVTAGTIRTLAKQGSQGPNQLKTFSRAGMGPCQGRGCGLTVSSLMAEQSGKSMDEVGYFNIRPPLKPVTLGELASLQEEDSRSQA